MKYLLIVLGALAALVVLVAAIGATLPKGHVVSRRARFQQSPEAIWALISGPPSWRPDIKSFEILPARDGRETWYEVDNHGQRITYEKVESIPPSRLVTRIADAKLPFGGTWTYQIAGASGRESTLTITERGEVYNPIFRFMSRFVFGQSATIENYLKAVARKFGEQVTIEAIDAYLVHRTDRSLRLPTKSVSRRVYGYNSQEARRQQ